MNIFRSKKMAFGLVLAFGLLTAVLVTNVFAAHNGGRRLFTELSAGNEVPPADSDGTGSAQITLNQGQERVCYIIEVEGLTSPVVAAHIHEAPAGVNGPVVVSLEIAGPDASERFVGCVSASKDQIKEIRQNPSEYYVNVHTVNIGSGEVRGQLGK